MMTFCLRAAALVLASGAAAAAPAPPAKAPAPAVSASTAAAKAPAPAPAVSTAPARPVTLDDIYGGTKYRDPFMKLGAGGGGGGAPAAAPVKEYDPEQFSIHGLELKGIMRDKTGPVALVVDPSTHMTFIVKGGRLLDLHRKPVPGVTGTVNVVQKVVTLMTADKDVQTLRLGEDANAPEE